MTVTVRPAGQDDFEALSRLDPHYPANRYLNLSREGSDPEVTWRLEWRERQADEKVYAEYPVERLRSAIARVDLFLTASVGHIPVGLLMVMLPAWTDSGEITDLAVDRPARGNGVGRALVDAAAIWARERGLRSLWVEPRADNGQAIEFYLRLGFRISGFNDRMYSNRDEPGDLTLFMHLPLNQLE